MTDINLYVCKLRDQIGTGMYLLLLGVHMGTLQILKCRELFFKGKHRVECQILINCCVSCVIFNKKYNLACRTLKSSVSRVGYK
jgi:hypothetical protein